MCSVSYEHMFAASPRTSASTGANTRRAATRRNSSSSSAAVRAVVRILALATAVLVAWSVLARPSGAHGPESVYRVKPYDTLWTIAQNHYGGDVRDGVWQIQQANHLAGTAIVPGERLVLP